MSTTGYLPISYRWVDINSMMFNDDVIPLPTCRENMSGKQNIVQGEPCTVRCTTSQGW